MIGRLVGRRVFGVLVLFYVFFKFLFRVLGVVWEEGRYRRFRMVEKGFRAVFFFG